MNAMTSPTLAMPTTTLSPNGLPDHDKGHIPVMRTEVIDMLTPRDGESYVDGTFGGGGYTNAALAAADCTVWAIDRDPDAITRGQALSALWGTNATGTPRLRLLQGGFGSMQQMLDDAGVTQVDGVMLDFGVSSFQIDDAERGFSFKADGPLDMRMAREGRSAADVVNTASEAELADIFHHYGEERHARRVARAIVQARITEPFETTGQLAKVIRSAVPSDRSCIDPATRSFQGLRIAVNDELGEIERVLEQALALLAPGGRLVVVSFHSLEDRLVKRAMAEAAGQSPGASRHDPRSMTDRGPQADFTLLTRKPLRPGDAECAANPRARSARLRAIVRNAGGTSWQSTRAHAQPSPSENARDTSEGTAR